MKCILCEKTIDNYSPEFHHFTVDEEHSAEICGECTGKFLKWQGKRYALLFPTNAMKKRFGGKK
jgi:beta-galactosidase GanA